MKDLTDLQQNKGDFYDKKISTCTIRLNKDIILDIDKLYDKERNESNKYKIYGKLNATF